MSFLGIAFGVAGLVAVILVWFKFYKAIKADAGEELLGSPIKMRKGDPASLEEFVAAYRRGEVPVPTVTVVAPGKTPGASEFTPLPAPDTQVPAVNVPVKARDPFLATDVRLAYLVCRTGLRDHHVFVNLPLSALCSQGIVESALSRTGIDLLICNAQMSPVAAIDVIGAQSPAPDSTKTAFLKSLGIRYLRLTAKSLPKPEALHALIYKM